MGRNVAHIGPHSRPHRFWKLDARTREGKRAAVLKEQLTAHVGGQPNVAERLLIDRAVAQVLRLELMDRRDLEAHGTPRDPREYFYVQNSLTRTLTALGLKGAPEHVPTLSELFAVPAAA